MDRMKKDRFFSSSLSCPSCRRFADHAHPVFSYGKEAVNVSKVTVWVISLFCIKTVCVLAEKSPAQTQFLYVRHGEVPGNDASDPSTYSYTGSGTDASLTKKGVDQASQCAVTISHLQEQRRIGKVVAIYASDLKRARETAKPIAQELGLDVHLRHNLREISWGCVDGQLVQKITREWEEVEERVRESYPDRKVRWNYLPVFESAETYNALLNRTLEELKTIAEAHEAGTILIIGHGRVLKTLIAEAKDTEENIPYPANCGIAEFTYSSEDGLQFIKVFEKDSTFDNSPLLNAPVH